MNSAIGVSERFGDGDTALKWRGDQLFRHFLDPGLETAVSGRARGGWSGRRELRRCALPGRLLDGENNQTPAKRIDIALLEP